MPQMQQMQLAQMPQGMMMNPMMMMQAMPPQDAMQQGMQAQMVPQQQQQPRGTAGKRQPEAQQPYPMIPQQMIPAMPNQAQMQGMIGQPGMIFPGYQPSMDQAQMQGVLGQMPQYAQLNMQMGAMMQPQMMPGPAPAAAPGQQGPPKQQRRNRAKASVA